MTYAGTPYAGGAYAGAGMLAADIPVDTEPTFSVEVAFTTDALATPAWVDISHDVRSWDVSRGRTRELERFQPGRLTVVLDNSDRAYDSQHATGPHFGNLRPMRRIRIRETFNGVTYPRFDGFVDRWNLDYPGGGKDAIATVTATDGFKVFNRTDLGPSVYHAAVDEDTPVLWWKTDEGVTAPEALNYGSLGSVGDGTYISPTSLGEEPIVVNDPGSSMLVHGPNLHVGNTVDNGVRIDSADFSFSNYDPTFTVSCWIRTDSPPPADPSRFFIIEAPAAVTLQVHPSNNKFVFAAGNTVPTNFAVESAAVVTVGVIYHVVCKMDAGAMSITVNGVKSTAAFGGLGTTFTGTMPAANTGFAYDFGGGLCASGLMSNLAVFSTALSDARIAVHYAAGSAPWQGDTPAARANRVLDLAEWPADLRELDAGQTTFQSATLQTTALEHLQKTAETEAGSLFMNRAGSVRLVDRDALAARTVQAIFGDGAGEIGYRRVEFVDGDATIRNRATISRLNGVAKVSTGTLSVEEFGRFDYVLDGLLHDTDAHSLLYAAWVVSNYQEPTRRVTSLELGPAAAGNEATLYPQILGRELGDKITVKVRHPDGTGVVFQQDVVIEGIADRWDPHSFRAATWTLSPAPGTF